MTCELLIRHGGKWMVPPVAEGAEIEWDRQGQPGKLTAQVIAAEGLDFEEGDLCRLRLDGEAVFQGYVFEKSRRGSSRSVIDVTVYDQLYYLKNKDTCVYTGKRADEVVRMIAGDLELTVGELENTGWVIPSRVEDNRTLRDMIESALEETRKATGREFVLYDDVGKLTLRGCGGMGLDLLLDDAGAGDYGYASSIAGETCNRVKLCYEDRKTGTRQVFVAQDGESIGKWGVLQYFEKVDDPVNARAEAAARLKLYNAKTRTLRLENVPGDIRVRPGVRLRVRLDLGDILLDSDMTVEQARHTFGEGQHLMELKLRGENFVT